MHNLLKIPIHPYSVNYKNSSVYSAIKSMENTSYQGRSLGIAFKILDKMLSDRVTIFMGLAGAMIPAGMRNIIVYLMEHNYIDCLVSTGANLFHDCHESLGFKHYKGTPAIDDKLLRKKRIDRIYDTFANDREFAKVDRYIINFVESLDFSRNYTTREFFYLLGKRLSKAGATEGIITAAYKANIPIYCPAVGDSSYGIALAILSHLKNRNFKFNVIEDVLETAKITANAPACGEFIIGGGTPKNFIQQSEVVSHMLKFNVQGLKYAVQLSQDSPVWGGLSGCTFEEATSWGKIAFDAKKIFVHVDATIALPLLASALAEKRKNKKRTPALKLEISGEKLKIISRKKK